MKKSKEELGRYNKAKCRELKQIRKEMAEQLGVELNQRECTFEGFCTGTCPKCKQEEKILNEALRRSKQQGKSITPARRYAAAGVLVAAAVSLSGCGNDTATTTLTGDIAVPIEDNPMIDGMMVGPSEAGEDITIPKDEPEGDTVLPEDNIDGGLIETEDELLGDVPFPEDEFLLEGDVVEVDPNASEEFEMIGEVPMPEEASDGEEGVDYEVAGMIELHSVESDSMETEF